MSVLVISVCHSFLVVEKCVFVTMNPVLINIRIVSWYYNLLFLLVLIDAESSQMT
jgi:hypothetical protein